MMHRNSRFLVLGFLVFLLSCKSEKDSGSLVTATLKGPSAMAMIHMIEDRDSLHGHAMKYLVKNEPNQVKAMILEESVDFAVVPSTMGVLLYNMTGKYILAGIPVWGTLYLFGSDTAVHGWQDLKGKKISLMARGMTPDIMFRYLAEKNGLDPDNDIELDYSFPTHIELANAIAAGISSLGVISEPMVSLVMKKNPDVQPIINFNMEWVQLFDAGIPFAQTALLVKKELAEQNPGLVSEYLEKLEFSINEVNGDPSRAAELIVKHKILPDIEVAKASIPRSNLFFSSASEEMYGIQEYFKVFYNFNPRILGGKLPDEEFYFKEKPD